MKQLPVARNLKRFVDILDHLSAWAVTILMAILTIVVLVQVFSRYILNNSLSWGTELPRFCFIIGVLLALPLGFKYNLHVNIDLVTSRFGKRKQKFFVRLNALLIVVLAAIIGYMGIDLLPLIWRKQIPVLHITTGIFYIVLAYSQLHTILRMFLIIFEGCWPSDRLSG